MEAERTTEGREVVELSAQEKPLKIPKVMMMKTRAGLTLCYIVIGLIGAISFAMLAYFFATTYSLKSLAQPLTPEALQIYKDARSAVADDILKISDRFLGSILLPIMTLLLGYMFGSRVEKDNAEEE